MANKIYVTTGVVPTNTQSLIKYMQEIKQTKLLTPEQEREIAMRAVDGDLVSQNKLVECNLRFVVQVSKQYVGVGVPLEDLIAFGNLGLFEAAKRFDPNRGVKFISFAVWYIRAALQSAINDHGRTVRIPSHQTKIAGEDYHASSIHDPIGEEGSETYADRYLPAEHGPSVQELEDMKKLIDEAIGNLKEKEDITVKMFYGIGMDYPRSMDDIAIECKVTGERARQLVRAGEIALKKLSNIKLLKHYL